MILRNTKGFFVPLDKGDVPMFFIGTGGVPIFRFLNLVIIFCRISARILFFSIVVVGSLFSQPTSSQKFWITFRDRGTAGLKSLSKSNAAELGLSERALWRRAKILSPNKLVDELDLPVDESYIVQLRAMGAKIHATSRWFNAVSVEFPSDQRYAIESLPFVSAIEPVKVSVKKEPEPSQQIVQSPQLKYSSTSGIDYGNSLTQLNSINVINVHNRGITGAGVIIGMIDDGFNQHKIHPALKNINVIAEYDFVQRDSNTSRAPGEYLGQGDHGAATLSTIGGFENGKLIGAAYGASFILAKTEIESVEVHVEEDLFVEALEWEERLGADIVSVSLGYDDFNPSGIYNPGDIIYRMKDGKTGTTSKAAAIAARKGVLFVAAMGNEGWYQRDSTFTKTLQGVTGSLTTPADADSIVSVGAVFFDGSLANFSSTGPTADGRIKPEVVAPGISVYTMYGEAGYRTSNGTSFATPLTAGVAALVLSAHPNYTPMQVRDRLTVTATHVSEGSSQAAGYPNNYFGWG
ncbi:MAG: S8 family serine peptidase, partial [Ignavibacteriales bacterium]|nr:S8 family serine peptidase [Ignavibacteriales bacterium]